ncbi:hypothetical protein DM02DRAFT_227900 [Periconia macrospinosa]|uniref:Secreted protein n=1 Tax=Periconia macrospinosa TaxID=97972 RepID=A0A2V1D5S7_9PLEO|nr:hypothetical protein DM02DRAFT_227900 [Periconia macrospinosa]
MRRSQVRFLWWAVLFLLKSTSFGQIHRSGGCRRVILCRHRGGCHVSASRDYIVLTWNHSLPGYPAPNQPLFLLY